MPATLFGALMLGCFAIAPVAIFDLSTDQANWWPVFFYAGLTVLATAGAYAWGMRNWLPIDLPLWLIALYVLAPLGDHLDAGGGLALTLLAVGFVLFFGVVARLIVFHVRSYRAEQRSLPSISGHAPEAGA